MMGDTILGRRGREVVITRAGVVTAVGTGVPAFWNALLEGASGLRRITLFDPTRYRAQAAAEVSRVPEDPCGELTERAHRLALAAALEAVSGDGALLKGPRAALSIGTTLGGNRSWTEWLGGARATDGKRLLAESSLSSLTEHLARRFGVRGPALTHSVACASGTAALGTGAELIWRDEADCVLAGGYDALSEFVFSGFDSLRALTVSRPRPFDLRRDGLALGEGAGFVLLEELGQARSRGAPILARISAYASGGDAHHMTRPVPTGEGLARTLRQVLHEAGVSNDAIGFISTHGTATRFNDRMESAAFRLVFADGLRHLPVNSIKGALGHTLGASGVLEAVMAALVLFQGWIPPTVGYEERDPECALDVVHGSARPLPEGARYALSTSSAFAGTNSALVLERP